MHMLYNSDSFAVVRIEVPAEGSAPGDAVRGGYEIVDKRGRREIFIDGELAERFRRGVQSLIDAGPDEQPDAEVFDDFIAGFAALAQHPVVLH
ncbi:MAG: DUF3567 domain-containing protein [Rubrivivax sp.]|jgi:hypothetical protein|nr:DUF3567 domain-containing protein [Rubrivivax sp.]